MLGEERIAWVSLGTKAQACQVGDTRQQRRVLVTVVLLSERKRDGHSSLGRALHEDFSKFTLGKAQRELRHNSSAEMPARKFLWGSQLAPVVL